MQQHNIQYRYKLKDWVHRIYLKLNIKRVKRASPKKTKRENKTIESKRQQLLVSGTTTPHGKMVKGVTRKQGHLEKDTPLTPTKATCTPPTLFLLFTGSTKLPYSRSDFWRVKKEPQNLGASKSTGIRESHQWQPFYHIMHLDFWSLWFYCDLAFMSWLSWAPVSSG